MNKYEHAQSSAKIFGGKSTEYEDIHALIDSNKVVTPSIFGRFFLHHFDIGLLILEKVFSEKIGKKKVPVKKLLLQHLFEDYDQVLTFEKHWMPALQENERNLPKLDEWSVFVTRSKGDSRLSGLSELHLKELENWFTLQSLGKRSVDEMPINLRLCIFCHALGADILAKIIGPKFHGFWTSDVLTGYLNCRFTWADRTRDPVPTLLDYERCIPDKPWMHAPKDYEDTLRKKPDRIKKKIDKYIGPVFTFKSTDKKIVAPRHLKELHNYRKPCNLD